LGTFYLHFRTKNEVFAELVADGAKALRDEIAQAKRNVTKPEEKLRVTVTTVLDAAAEHPETFRIVAGHSPAFLDLMVRVHEILVRDLAADLRPALGTRAAAVARLTVGMLSRAVEMERRFNPFLFVDTIIPCLKQLGLINQRTEPWYRDLGVKWPPSVASRK